MFQIFGNLDVSVLLWGLSAARTTLCAAETVSHPHLQESHLVSHMEAPCFCRQIWSTILQRGIIGAPCSESTLTSWVPPCLCSFAELCLPLSYIKIYFNLDCAYKRSIHELPSLFPGWASNPYHTLYKTKQNLQKMPYTSYLESQV